MAWTNSAPSHTTPAQRRRIMTRDNRECQISGPYCEGTAVDVDHINNQRGPEYDTDTNLQAVCRPCHKAKTQQESYRRRWYRRPHQPSIGEVERSRRRS